MAEARVEEHEAIEVGVIGLEEARRVEGVVVFDKGADLHLVADPALDHGAEWVPRRALRQRQLRVPVHHAFGPDEDEVELHAREDVGQLEPDFARERRFRPRAKDEDPHRIRTLAQTFDVHPASRLRGVEQVS